MAVPDSFLLRETPAGDAHVVSVTGGRAATIAVFSGRGGGQYAGPVRALFRPANWHSPWTKGDVLLAESESVGRQFAQRIIRLRPIPGRRGAYGSEVVYEGSGRKAIISLAFDPQGRLYFAEEGSRTIRRFGAAGRGSMGLDGWQVTLPSTVPWGGDFQFAPDGPLLVSTGAAAMRGALYKLNVTSDPEPGEPDLPAQVTAQRVYQATRRVRGFTFFDGDKALFTDGGGRIYSVDLPAWFDAGSAGGPYTPGPGEQTLSGATPSGSSGYSFVGVACADNAIQRRIADEPRLADSLRWRTLDNTSRAFDGWQDRTDSQDLERLLYRFYAYRVADRQPPLAYRYQVHHTETGPSGQTVDVMRVAPECEFNLGPIRRHDAIDTFLAYVAHFFWMDISGRAVWGFAKFDDDQLADLLDSDSMFFPFEHSDSFGSYYEWDARAMIARGFNYVHNAEVLGNAFPSNPYLAYQFIEGDPSVRDGDTFFYRGDYAPDAESPQFQAERFLRWIRAHLSHNRLDLPPLNDEYWGSQTFPPLEAFHQRSFHGQQFPTPRYYAWPGCQSASGFAMHVLRLMLVPAKRLRTYIGDALNRPHGGLQIGPNALILHLDEVYESTHLRTYWPANIQEFFSTDHMSVVDRMSFLQPPADEADRLAREDQYKRMMAKVAVKLCGHSLMLAYFNDRIAGDHVPSVVGDNVRLELLSSFGLTHAEAGWLFDVDAWWRYDAKVQNIFGNFGAEITATDDSERLSHAKAIYEREFAAAWERRSDP